MELSHLSYEGDQQDDDQDKERKKRFNPINPVTKKAISGWLSPSETPKAPSDQEQRMPFSIVAPEGGDQPSRTIPHEAALHSEAWLGSAVRPPEYDEIVTPAVQETVGDYDGEDNDREILAEQSPGTHAHTQEPADRQESPAQANVASQASVEDDAFQRLLHQAGLDELSRSLEEQPTEQDPGETRPPEQAWAGQEQGQPTPTSEYVPRSQARTRALIAFAAGLIIGSHFNKKKVRQELTKTLEEVDEQMATNQYRQQQGEGLQPETHTVRDAWHNIAVDANGNEDLAARTQYGAAFRQEQQEVRQSSLADTTPAGSTSAVQGSLPPVDPYVALSPVDQAPALSDPATRPQLSSAQLQTPSLPDGLTQPQLPTGPLIQEDPQHLLPVTTHAKMGASFIVNPWVWLVAGLLILVFFAASLIG